jgi:hypothetical protein
MVPVDNILAIVASLHPPEGLYRGRAAYECAIAASMFESTPSCAKITVPEG